MIGKYRAKTLKSGRWVEGYYAEYQETTYCFVTDYEANPVKTIHVLMVEEMTDWGLPNKLVEYEIDPLTLTSVDIVAEKQWKIQDIKDALITRGFTDSKENVQKIIDTGYLNELEEATEYDWDVIDCAIYARDDLEER
jgi:hypothetical protein